MSEEIFKTNSGVSKAGLSVFAASCALVSCGSLTPGDPDVGEPIESKTISKTGDAPMGQSSISGFEVMSAGSAHPPFSERFHADGKWVAFYNQRAQTKFEGTWEQTGPDTVCVDVTNISRSHHFLGERICRKITIGSVGPTITSFISPNRTVGISIKKINEE